MTVSAVKFPCRDIVLEGIWHLPDGEGGFPVVIVCHPHPLYGGDMYHPIVVGICNELVRRNIAALRFNFRGVGKSGGAYAEGIGEREDVKAAIEFGLSNKKTDAKKVGLAGYSFGASVITPVAAGDGRVGGMALISPVFEAAEWDPLYKFTRHKFLIAGERDAYISRRLFERMAKSLPQPAQYYIIKDADHFWDGYEAEVAGKVSKFFAEGFKLP